MGEGEIFDYIAVSVRRDQLGSDLNISGLSCNSPAHWAERNAAGCVDDRVRAHRGHLARDYNPLAPEAGMPFSFFSRFESIKSDDQLDLQSLRFAP
jgi:hypothetical protein